MQTGLPRLVIASAFSLLASQASAFVVRAPLVGFLLPGPGESPPASWFTETRVVNLGNSVATVAVTDVIGYGNPTRLTFTIPALGIADLPYQKFIDLNAPDQEFLALIEFTSDQPISVHTTITTYTLTLGECLSTGGIPPSVILAYWGGGCVPLAGPLVHGFTDYLAAGTDYLLPWLVGDDSFRSNLYLVNPGAEPISVQATFRRGTTAEVFGHAAFTVLPHSMLIVPRAFQTAVVRARAPARNEGIKGPFAEPLDEPIYLEAAMTGVFRATGPFYVLAGVVNNINRGKDSINRFAMVQPEALP